VSYTDIFRVAAGSNVRLSAVDPDFKEREDKAAADAEMAPINARLTDLQYLLYAEHERSLLIVLQGLDGAGKDGTIRHVFSFFNPQGTRVHGFKVPSTEEADHDFLWRAHLQVPAKGEIVIFNRSHYEDVLVTRVHGLVPERVWQERYDLINAFEHNLTLAGTTILKFFLHIGEDEQLRRFKARLDDPMRQWKISESDYTDRAFFKEYLQAYGDAIGATSTLEAPWFVIPSNHKWFRDLAISSIVMETLASFGMKTPAPNVDLDDIRRKYHSAEKT